MHIFPANCGLKPLIKSNNSKNIFDSMLDDALKMKFGSDVLKRVYPFRDELYAWIYDEPA